MLGSWRDGEEGVQIRSLSGQDERVAEEVSGFCILPHFSGFLWEGSIVGYVHQQERVAAGSGCRWERLKAGWGMKKGESDLDPLYGR